ncbi:hypothetical protein V2J09_020376 [Rumex salicifolius]
MKSSHRILSLLSNHPCLSTSHLRQIQSLLIVTGTVSDPFAAGKLLAAFTATSDRASGVSDAYRFFLRLPHRTTHTWNSMIKGFAESNQSWKALSVYEQMVSNGFMPNNYTFSFVIRAAVDLSCLLIGCTVHAQAIKLGWESYDFVQNGLVHLYAVRGDFVGDARKLFDESPNRDVFTWTAMINGYVKSAQLDAARELFDEMPERNVVTWSTMITGCAQMGFSTEALELFTDMQLSGFRPNHTALVGALTACAFLGALEQGKWIHAYVNRNRIKLDTKLGTALVDMYMKSGCIDMATVVFEQIPDKDVYAFTSMISGLSNNGLSLRSIEFFNRMKGESVKPNRVTLLCVLSACSRMGLVEEGLRIFKNMEDEYGIKPETEHLGCAVDLLGRAGLLAEAEEMVGKMMAGEPDSYVLGALLNACRIHGDIELGEKIVKRLEREKLDHGGSHALLLNMYASAEQWEGVEKVRKEMMEDKRKRKMPGIDSFAQEVDYNKC